MKYNGIPVPCEMPGKTSTNKQKLYRESFYADNALGLYVLTHGSSHAHGEATAQKMTQLIFDTIRTGMLNQTAPSATQERDTLVVTARSLVVSSIKLASKALFKEKHGKPKAVGLFCSTVVVLCVQDVAIVAHVGNCRAYLIRNKNPIQLTKDHTLYQDMMDAGEDAFTKVNPEFKKELTRALGIAEDVAITPRAIQLDPTDQIVLCTNGLSDQLSPNAPELAKILANPNIPTLLKGSLAQYISRSEAKENPTFILVSVAPGGEYSARPDYMGITDKIEYLKNIPTFRGIWGMPEALMEMASLLKVKEVKAGETIIGEDSESQEMFIVVTGKADALVKGQKVSTVTKYGLIGEIGFLTQMSRTATVVATEPCRLLVLGRPDFYKLLQYDKDVVIKFTFGVIEELSKKLKLGSETVAELKANQSG